jgi:hypothetical protein
MQKLPVPDDVDELLETVNPADFSRVRPDANPLSYATWYLWRTPASRHTTAGPPPTRTAVISTSTKLTSETLAAVPPPFSEHSAHDRQDQR